MLQRLPMQEQKEGRVLANGTATVEFGPTSYGESWITAIVGVQNIPTPPATTLTNIPSVKVYANNVFVGDSRTGDQDSDTSMTVEIPSGQKLRAVWSGGDPNSVVILTMTGTKVIL